jgi:hypothetical protein
MGWNGKQTQQRVFPSIRRAAYGGKKNIVSVENLRHRAREARLTREAVI